MIHFTNMYTNPLFLIVSDSLAEGEKVVEYLKQQSGNLYLPKHEQIFQKYLTYSKND